MKSCCSLFARKYQSEFLFAGIRIKCFGVDSEQTLYFIHNNHTTMNSYKAACPSCRTPIMFTPTSMVTPVQCGACGYVNVRCFFLWCSLRVLIKFSSLFPIVSPNVNGENSSSFLKIGQSRLRFRKTSNFQCAPQAPQPVVVQQPQVIYTQPQVVYQQPQVIVQQPPKVNHIIIQSPYYF